ncbi:hypothetical protein [Methylorubrum thiocyanatum]|uniref:hypothetical protein n=1 Tax=Methylorubrum thiocyanatum TaxID=47958 RepID=UPI003F80DF3B
MREAPPNAVAAHYATCTALAFSAVAVPFLPEAVLLYAGIQYLRGFLYGSRQWRAPARVPLTLGRRGYRDATTRKRGEATWPVGTADGRQVWLLRQDLAQGCAFQGDDPDWQAASIERLVFAACLNRMGAVVVQDHAAPPLAGRIAAVARPFGCDLGMAAIDLHASLTPPLHLTTSAIEAALGDLGLSEKAQELNRALSPVLRMIGTRHGLNALALYRAFLDAEALSTLSRGEYEIDGLTVNTDGPASADAAALVDLQALGEAEREEARQELAPYARELACTTGLSLTDGLDLGTAIAARRLTCIRPASPLTAVLVQALCCEALAAQEPVSGSEVLVHLGELHALSADTVRRFLTSTTAAGAIGTVALPSTPDATLMRLVSESCRIRFEHRSTGKQWHTHLISTLKDCTFSRDIEPFLVERSGKTGNI